MSVFTEVHADELQDWLRPYSLQLVSYSGIAAGVTNSNYAVTAREGRFVLTLFETLALDALPFYLNLMRHLAQHGVACPAPQLDKQGRFASMLAGRPACIVTWLTGGDVTLPTPPQCQALGDMLARMHQATASFTAHMPNPRGEAWWQATATRLYPLMPTADAKMLQQEIQLLAAYPVNHLPHGVIHADLFKDNVLMQGNDIAGFIDFYYACNDALLFDLAIALNDWARMPNGTLDDQSAQALLAGYQAIRPLCTDERERWPFMLRRAAVRFWVSRLLDHYYPLPGSLTYTKDPADFQKLLAQLQQRSTFWL